MIDLTFLELDDIYGEKKLELFDKARHDILHETHVSSKVYSFIKDFINE